MRGFALVAFVSVALAQTSKPAVQLITSDIENFWKAYDGSQEGNREEAFQKLYLDPGSPGLKDFVKLRIQSSKALATAIDQVYPKFYASVRPYTFKVEEQRGTILKLLDRFRELYPEAQFPPVYFVIGRLTSGGTTSERGLLIGTEVNSLGPDVNISEINPAFRRAMGSADHIPLIVVHELTHTQKKRADREKLPYLLDQSIEEGAADFMTELVAGSSINAYAKEWADARRDELFQRFAADMKAKPNDTGRWLYNYRDGSEQLPDLGYWIGAEICRSYYAHAKDKREAIRNIVTLVSTESIVRNSQYASLRGSQ